MTTAQLATAAVLLAALVGQALVPTRRLVIVTTGALAAIVATTATKTATLGALFASVPWDVLVIVVVLGLLTESFAESRVFGLLALGATRLSGADPKKLLLIFALGMYAVSGLVNNLTALLLVLPVLLGLAKLLSVSQRYVSLTLGAMLVSCNLGGAATPIGDFPAILLLGRGAMTFTDYLARAAPATAVALAVFLTALVLVGRPTRDLERSPLSAALAVRTMRALYRGITVDRRAFAPAALALALMLAAWTLAPASLRLGAELVAWAGVWLALLARPGAGERLLRERVDVEAALFLLSLFLMVGAVRATGTFELAGRGLLALPVSPTARVLLFLVVAALSTGLFSAGPGMAALLDVATVLAGRHPPHAIYVGLALAVCAGSSLFLTAATSGPLAQALTERAGVRDPRGEPIRFGFFEFAPVGLAGFGVILATALVLTALSL